MRESWDGQRVRSNPIETDIQIGLREIVESIYGEVMPVVSGLDFGRSYLGAARDFVFGGDLVDVFHRTDGCTSIAVLDITGHGIAAAMHAGIIKHALRAYFSQGSTVLHAVRALNHLCIETNAAEGTEDFFATLFFGVIDRERRNLRYVSAGHGCAFIFGPSTQTALDATGPMIGLLDDPLGFSSKTIALTDRDTIAIVTDGFTEARNTAGKFLGSKALNEILSAQPNEGAQMSAQAVTHRVFEYTQQNNHDDIAALIVKIVDAHPREKARNGAIYSLATAAGSDGIASTSSSEPFRALPALADRRNIG